MRRTSSTFTASRILSAICPLAVAIAALTAAACIPKPYFAPEGRDTIFAIDLALEADRTPPDPSLAVKPHVTLLQGFVRGQNLQHFTSAAAMVMTTTDLARVKIRTLGASTAAGVPVDPSLELRRLSERMAEVFRPFAVDPETARSFIVTPDGSTMNETNLLGIGNFIPDAAGVNYRPHISAATGQQPPSSLTPMGVAVYQLDKSGLPQRTLWTWTGENGAR